MQKMRSKIYSPNISTKALVWCCLSLFIVPALVLLLWPGLLSYLGVVYLPAKKYHAAVALGKSGGFFCLRQAVLHPDKEVRDLAIDPGIEEYLLRYNGNEKVWDLIVWLLTDPKMKESLDPYERRSLEKYIYGRDEYISDKKTSRRRLFFPVEKVQWANVHLFNRPLNHNIPEELLQGNMVEHSANRKE